MKVSTLEVSCCRNISSVTLEADEELTVISGHNAQGKTSLLECIWLLTGAKSFRGAKDFELVKQGQEYGHIKGETFSSTKKNNIEINIAGQTAPKRGRSAKVNGVPYARATEIAGIFTAVVFDPGHLTLVKGGPEGRRRFLDAALCQLYPGYVGILRRYARILAQKNALLKKFREMREADAMLDVFDEEMFASGTEITKRRQEYLELLAPQAQSIYAELASGKEELNIKFLPCCEQNGLMEMLKKSRPTDIRAGFCTTGPHREDFESEIDDRSTRTFGSQGQQRSTAIALKLAEAAAARQITGEHPVLLLDDVLSELDETRQQYLLSRMSGKQSFVTTCDALAFGRAGGKVITMQNGQIV